MLLQTEKLNSRRVFSWYRIWAFFLAYSTIISRNGGCSVFQLTLHKNLNAYPRILGVPNHMSIHVKPNREIL